MVTEKEKSKTFRLTEEYKRKSDELAQKIGLSFEELRLPKKVKRFEESGVYVVLDVFENEIVLRNRQGMIVSIDLDDGNPPKSSLRKGQIIKATIYSDPDEHGMTSHWYFKKTG